MNPRSDEMKWPFIDELGLQNMFDCLFGLMLYVSLHYIIVDVKVWLIQTYTVALN